MNKLYDLDLYTVRKIPERKAILKIEFLRKTLWNYFSDNYSSIWSRFSNVYSIAYPMYGVDDILERNGSVLTKKINLTSPFDDLIDGVGDFYEDISDDEMIMGLFDLYEVVLSANFEIQKLIEENNYPLKAHEATIIFEFITLTEKTVKALNNLFLNDFDMYECIIFGESFRIVDKKATIVLVEEFDDDVEEHIVDFYSYKTTIDEKKKIITLLATKIEPLKKKIPKNNKSSLENIKSNAINTFGLIANTIPGIRHNDGKQEEINDEDLNGILHLAIDCAIFLLKE